MRFSSHVKDSNVTLRGVSVGGFSVYVMPKSSQLELKNTDSTLRMETIC